MITPHQRNEYHALVVKIVGLVRLAPDPGCAMSACAAAAALVMVQNFHKMDWQEMTNLVAKQFAIITTDPFRPFSVTQLRIRNGSSCPIPDLAGHQPERLSRWIADIRTGFLRELSGCSLPLTAPAVGRSWE
jgi:hypothetical protein